MQPLSDGDAPGADRVGGRRRGKCGQRVDTGSEKNKLRRVLEVKVSVGEGQVLFYIVFDILYSFHS